MWILFRRRLVVIRSVIVAPLPNVAVHVVQLKRVRLNPATILQVIVTCHALGSNSAVISPSLAAWLPLIILAPVAYFNGAAIW
jgi:hypothetical protein